MVDPLTGAAAGEVAKAGGGVLSRLLGPTADEMGAQLVEWYKRKNVERVVARADAKASTGAAGAIPPRVAAEVFEKAQWADDEFVAEYLSGVLATARTPEGKDDRAVSWTALVGRLSADQLRLHYIVYRAYRGLGKEPEIDTVSSAIGRPIVFYYSALMIAMGEPEPHDFLIRLLDAAYGLEAEGLLGATLSHGPVSFLNKIVPGHTFPLGQGGRDDTDGILQVSGSTRGASLFLHAHGLGGMWAAAIFDPDVDLDLPWPDGGSLPEVPAMFTSSFADAAPSLDVM